MIKIENKRFCDLKDEFYKKIVKNEDSEEFINWVMGVEDENELDN